MQQQGPRHLTSQAFKGDILIGVGIFKCRYGICIAVDIDIGILKCRYGISIDIDIDVGVGIDVGMV